MTLSINITADPSAGTPLRKQIEESMAALGFVRDDHHILKSLSDTLQQGAATSAVSANADIDATCVQGGDYQPGDYQPGDYQPGDEDAAFAFTKVAVDAEGYYTQVGDGEKVYAAASTQPAAIADEILGTNITGAAAPARQRGKPSAGKARRTAAEVEEDKQADAADAAAAQAATEAGIQAVDPADVKPAISSGEERISPEDAATEAQDRADEAAEAFKTAKGLTLDDLRQAVGAYQRKFGMAAAVADVPAVLGCKVVEVPIEKLEWAIGEMAQAVALNPYERDIVGGDMAEQVVKPEPEKPAAVETPKTATRDELIAAMIAYAKKFDGPGADPRDAASMPFANEDCPKAFKLALGDTVDKLSAIPATPEAYGKALAAIEEMTAKDPFKRAAK